MADPLGRYAVITFTYGTNMAIRTIVLLRYLSEPELRESVTTITNRVESFHNFRFSDYVLHLTRLRPHQR